MNHVNTIAKVLLVFPATPSTTIPTSRLKKRQILRAMLLGNIPNLKYDRVHFVLGGVFFVEYS